MNNRVELEEWIFDCPMHGWEQGVYCFRAFDENNVDRWKKMWVLRDEIETTPPSWCL